MVLFLKISTQCKNNKSRSKFAIPHCYDDNFKATIYKPFVYLISCSGHLVLNIHFIQKIEIRTL